METGSQSGLLFSAGESSRDETVRTVATGWEGDDLWLSEVLATACTFRNEVWHLDSERCFCRLIAGYLEVSAIRYNAPADACVPYAVLGTSMASALFHVHAKHVGVLLTRGSHSNGRVHRQPSRVVLHITIPK